MYSHTNSSNTHGDTQFSVSRGTSGAATTVSTVSIELRSHIDFFRNDDDTTQSYEIQMDANGDITGVRWDTTTDGDNKILFGSEWQDLLYGGNDEDIIYGFEGDDIIVGGERPDRLFGNAGNDIIFTGERGTLGDQSIENPDGTPSEEIEVRGNDTFASGGTGDDRIIGSQRRDVIFGGPGHDIIEGGRGNDRLYGGDGNDFISGSGRSASSHHMSGGRGDDYIIVLDTNENSNNDLHGDEGDDRIYGSRGDDDIYGGPGNDIIDGDDGDDEIWGGEGDDILKGGRARRGDL